jgi:hypothetical protein
VAKVPGPPAAFRRAFRFGWATGGARSCACAHAWRAGEKSGFLADITTRS